MASNFVSTYNLLNGPRLFARNAQAQVARLNQELVTERHSDVGLVLGARTGKATLLHQELAGIDRLKAANGATSARVGTTSAIVSELRSAADTFMATLVGLPTNETSAATVHGEAGRNLTTLIDKLNSAHAGQQLFGGVKTETAPAKDGSAAVDTAFENFRTAFQTYWTASGNTGTATVNDIGARELGLFLNPVDPASPDLAGETPAFIALATATWDAGANARFDREFDAAAWSANWSSASDTNIKSQISATETLTTSVSANADPFRALARAYSVIGSLPADQLNAEAFKTAVNYAIAQLGEAVNGLTIEEANLGSTQNRLKTVNEQLTLQRTLLNDSLVAMEGVDPYEVKVKADALELQISLSYSLTSRLQKLNILNYL